MVLAGGEGKRLWPLTADRAKPAVPFGGHYRLIDFALSNLVNGGFREIVVLTQYKSHSLDVHLSLSWRLSTLLGNFVTSVPAQMRIGPRWFLGSADALFQNLNLIADHLPDQVLVFGADHIYRMDPRPMLDQHVTTGAAVTVAAIRVPRAQAHQFGVFEVGAGSTRAIGFREKPLDAAGLPGAPDAVLASMGNYIFRTEALVDLLHRDAQRVDSAHDIGGDLIPELVAAGQAHVYDFMANEIPGEVEHGRHYWRDVGTLDSYYDAHMDLVSALPLFDLYNPEWPIHTGTRSLPPAKLVEHGASGRASVNNALLSLGVIVSGGTVIGSVLSPGVTVGAGALVEHSILLDDVVIGAGARVRNAILDKNTVVPPGATVGYDAELDQARELVTSPGGVVVARKNSVLASD